MTATKKELTAKYDRLFAEASAIIIQHDPCGVRDGTGTCRHPKLDFCCDRCRYLTKKGCRVKSLGCRVWACSYLRDNHKEIVQALAKIKREGGWLAHGVRNSKKGSIEYAHNWINHRG